MTSLLLPAQYRNIFEALPGAFLLLLPDADFTIAGVSDEYLRATLTERDAIVGHPLFEMFPDNPDTPDANSTANLSRSLKRVVATRRADVMAVQRYDVRRADGTGFDVRYWSPVNAPIFADDGELLCIAHRVDNVTEYVRLTEAHAEQRAVTEMLTADKVSMEAEIVRRSIDIDNAKQDLQVANAELAEYARRAREAAQGKDEFLAMLAHELRNPLAAITSALQLWDMAAGADEARQERLLAVCKRQTKNLTRLVDDLLEMSRIDRGAVELQRKALNLRDVVDSAVHAVRELFDRHRLTMSTRVAPANFTAFGDATRLEQVLANLLTNAAKYSHPDGQVELLLEPLPSQKNWARIVVTDHGRGIPAEKLDVIFDVFVQVDPGIDRARGGLGIGLALVRSIVKLHGGTVRAESEGLGHGSRFIVELPLMSEAGAQQDAHRPTEQPALLPPAPSGAHRILVVEDNPDARDMLCALLTAFGYAVTTAADGSGGLEKLLHLRPDIAIIDIGLPGIDGLEIARRARAAIGRKTKLVALTGYTAPAVEVAALDAGFDMHIAKPCTPEKLASILAS